MLMCLCGRVKGSWDILVKLAGAPSNFVSIM